MHMHASVCAYADHIPTYVSVVSLRIILSLHMQRWFLKHMARHTNYKTANNFLPVAQKFTMCTDRKQPLNLPVMSIRV